MATGRKGKIDRRSVVTGSNNLDGPCLWGEQGHPPSSALEVLLFAEDGTDR